MGKVIVWGVLFVAFWVLFAMAFAFPLKWAWNGVVPYVFNVPYIDWSHAFCLLAVCGILFGGTSKMSNSGSRSKRGE